ncbi:ribosome hibernation promotion factor [Phytoactinopolyspora limicola]|uniref:ribosome hibernation promotion factor n=1 Tax=Phytoactinopolyspora limicola TaxID=2715536 RepID=UPI00140950E8|nr:HPF/RaiA family ribosome-associated protein [Phytoactinopolyspora limicola]
MTTGLSLVPEINISADPAVPAAARDRACHKISALTRYASEPILHARIRFSGVDPRQGRSVTVQVNLDVNGRLLRAQVSADTPFAAIDLVEDRLRRGLARMARHWEARRGGTPRGGTGEWRHQATPTNRPPYYPRPVGERRVITHKTYAPARITPADAALDMDQMDYDFYLFTDADTGQDGIVYRAGATGYRLAYVDPGDAGDAAQPVLPAALTLSPHPAPVLSDDEARHRLDLTRQLFVFYADDAVGRGRVVYRRYDGHYGLITPAR